MCIRIYPDSNKALLLTILALRDSVMNNDKSNRKKSAPKAEESSDSLYDQLLSDRKFNQFIIDFNTEKHERNSTKDILNEIKIDIKGTVKTLSDLSIEYSGTKSSLRTAKWGFGMVGGISVSLIISLLIAIFSQITGHEGRISKLERSVETIQASINDIKAEIKSQNTKRLATASQEELRESLPVIGNYIAEAQQSKIQLKLPEVKKLGVNLIELARTDSTPQVKQESWNYALQLASIKTKLEGSSSTSFDPRTLPAAPIFTISSITLRANEGLLLEKKRISFSDVFIVNFTFKDCFITIEDNTVDFVNTRFINCVFQFSQTPALERFLIAVFKEPAVTIKV
jgi:hypothetical protein